jgi:tyrosine-protein phosphatase SIW14
MENYMKVFFLFLFFVQSISFAEMNPQKEEILSDNIRNFHKVSDGIYRSAQPNKNGMELLDITGVKTVINLRKYHSDAYEAKNTSLTLMRLKMNAGKIGDENIIEALTLIKNSEKPVLIHCWHGSDRTGAVVAMYRIIFEGYSKEEAIKELREERYGYHESIYGNIIKYINNADIEKLKLKIL